MTEGETGDAMVAQVEKRDNNRACFLDLPADVRNRIYRYALVTSLPIEVGLGRHPPVTPCRNLLRCCKTIHAEAAPILYSSNYFIIWMHNKRLDFITSIGGSRKFLRELEFRGVSNHNKACWLLEDAKQLQRLVFHPSIAQKFDRKIDLVRSLRPVMKALHEQRKGTEKKQALQVLEFVEINKRKWGVDPAIWYGVERRTRVKLERFLAKVDELGF